MNGTKGIAGISIIALGVWAFFTMSSTNAVKEESKVAVMNVERIRHACEWADLKGDKEEYKLCKERLATAEAVLANKSAGAEKRVASTTAQFDELAKAAAAEINTESNGKVDLEAATAAKLAEIPD